MVGTPAAASGQRSALSLPGLGDEHVWPVLSSFDKACTNRVRQDIISFLTKAFFLPQAMFKEITLPIDLQTFGSPFLPFTQNRLHPFCHLGKPNDYVPVDGHYDGEPNVPNSLFVSIFDRLDQIGCDLVMRQLIDSTPSATNRNKVTGFARVYPEWDIMRQSFAVGNLHERQW